MPRLHSLGTFRHGCRGSSSCRRVPVFSCGSPPLCIFAAYAPPQSYYAQGKRRHDQLTLLILDLNRKLKYWNLVHHQTNARLNFPASTAFTKDEGSVYRHCPSQRLLWAGYLGRMDHHSRSVVDTHHTQRLRSQSSLHLVRSLHKLGGN
jgi:hypothetical protein